MDKFLKIAIICIAPTILLASGDNEAAQRYLELTGRHTDLAPRIFNFVLLAGLLYYLLAGPIKNFLKSRSDSIAGELEEIENTRQASKDAKLKAEEDLEKAKAKAKEILEDAKAELALIKKSIEEKTQEELNILEKSHEEKCEIEERKMVKETTSKVLSESIDSSDIPLDASKIVNIVTKEVA
jgi:F-type H+-transporting ATPase subunit b